MNLSKAVALACAAGIALPVTAGAQEGALEEITVTARKRAENLQEAPVAVSAFGSAQLDQLAVGSAMDLSAKIPNFLAPQNTVSFSAPQFYMRGVGRAENNWNFENAVAVFVDDVYLQSTAGAYIDMVDFERVEVLRGPQGTLYGRNATTGAVKFIPRRPPLDAPTLKADLAIGEHARTDARVFWGVPLILDRLGMKLDVYYTENEGYRDRVDAANQVVDDEIDRMKHYGGRLAFLYRATDAVDVELNLDARKEEDGTNLITPIVPVDGGDPFSKDGSVGFVPLYGVNRVGGEDRVTGDGTDFDAWNAVFKVSWDTGVGTFKSITGFRTYEDEYDSQLSGFPFPLQIPVGPGAFITLSTYIDSYNDFEQLTQEFQFTGEAGRLKYTLGAYYFDNDWTQVQFVGPLIPVEFAPPNGGAVNDTTQQAKSYAVYVDTTFEINEAWDVAVGGRYTKDEKEVRYETRLENGFVLPGFPVYPDKDWSKFTPRVSLNWSPRDGLLAYASYGEGYKAGALQGARTTDPESASKWLDPEEVETWEIGLKADWFDNSLRTNLAVFKSEYTDKADIFFSGSSVDAATADLDIDGIEVELVYAPNDALTLFANAGFLDCEYSRADANSPIFRPGGLAGQQPAPGLDAEPVVCPDYNYLVGGSYAWQLPAGGSLTLAASLQGTAEHYGGLGVENFDSEIVEAYDVLDASLAWRSSSGAYSVTLGGKNLTDEEYWVTSFFGSIPGRTYADGLTWYLRFGYEMN